MIITEKYQKTLAQAGKFILVGLFNTGVDFAILNGLMFLTGIDKGQKLLALNAISFGLAVINSYFLNRFWTFGAKKIEENAERVKEFFQFLLVSVGGLIINSLLVYFIATFVPPAFGLNSRLWANFAKVLATAASLCWNFLGYKFIVFKK